MTSNVPNFETRGSFLRPRSMPAGSGRALRLIAGFVVIAAGVGLLLGSDAGIVRVILLQKHTQQMDQRIDELTRRRAELRERLDRLANDQSTFERVARESYGLARRDEIVFLLPGRDEGPSWRKAPPASDFSIPGQAEAEDIPLDTGEGRQ